MCFCAVLPYFLFSVFPQAIKALKEEGIEVILMNPNIASVQTNTDNKSPHKADQVYHIHCFNYFCWVSSRAVVAFTDCCF